MAVNKHLDVIARRNLDDFKDMLYWEVDSLLDDYDETKVDINDQTLHDEIMGSILRRIAEIIENE